MSFCGGITKHLLNEIFVLSQCRIVNVQKITNSQSSNVNDSYLGMWGKKRLKKKLFQYILL